MKTGQSLLRHLETRYAELLATLPAQLQHLVRL